MACVAPGHHGGDAGGDPPEDRQPKRLPYLCEGSGKRGPTKHKALKKNFKQNNNQPLEIEFDVGDLKTFKPVGPYAANLSTYIGELVRKIPQYYESWDKVPAAEKATLIPNLQRYFQLERHLRDQTVILVKNEKRTVGSLVRAGLQKDFAKSYKDNKNKFKKRWFDSANSVEEARNRKPPKWKAGDDEWQKLVNFWASPERMKQSERNSRNRSKNKVTTHQGSMSFAQGRHQFFSKKRYREDLVETWRRCHSDKKGRFTTKENERIYGEMKALQDAVKEKQVDPKTDLQIIDEVLDSQNRGHIAGVGRVVPGTGSSSRSTQVDTGLCTREEMEEMKKQHAMELQEQRNLVKEQRNLFKQFLDFYNRQQGTPASQFQIPDSCTTMFPGSTYSRGEPSTAHSDPSSDLDLDNCYKPVSVDEDDDGVDDSGHDVGDGGSSSEFDDDE